MDRRRAWQLPGGWINHSSTMESMESMEWPISRLSYHSTGCTCGIRSDSIMRRLAGASPPSNRQSQVTYILLERSWLRSICLRDSLRTSFQSFQSFDHFNNFCASSFVSPFNSTTDQQGPFVLPFLSGPAFQVSSRKPRVGGGAWQGDIQLVLLSMDKSRSKNVIYGYTCVCVYTYIYI